MRSFALFVVVCLSSIAWAGEPADGEVAWRAKYDRAYQEMKVRNRPMLVFIKSDACLFCKRMEAGTYRNPGVARRVNEDFVPAVVNSSQDPTLAKQFRAKVFPTTIIVAPGGQVVDMISGYITAEKLQSRLSQAETKLR